MLKGLLQKYLRKVIIQILLIQTTARVPLYILSDDSNHLSSLFDEDFFHVLGGGWFIVKNKKWMGSVALLIMRGI